MSRWRNALRLGIHRRIACVEFVRDCEMTPPHSTRTFAAFMIGVHRAMSLFTSVASACLAALCLVGNVAAEIGQALAHGVVVERLVERIGDRSRIGCGVAFGANRPHQARHRGSGSPASAVVGMLGSAALRFAVPVA